MAIESISHAEVVRLPRSHVWKCMLDPQILAQCISGCEQLVLDSDNRYRIVANYRAGPFSRTFKGTVMVTDLVPAVSLKFRRGSYKPVEGPGAFSGSVILSDAPGGTLVRLDAEMDVSGPLYLALRLLFPRRRELPLREYVEEFERVASLRL